MSDFSPNLQNAEPLTLITAAAIVAAGLLIFGLLIAFLVYAIKCARRKDALLYKYEGFFTSWQAYIYMLYSMLIPLAPIFGIGGICLLLFDKEEMMPKDILIPYIVVCFIAFFVVMLLKKGRKRKLERKYGPVAAKEICKAMRDTGWGIAFGIASSMFGVIAFESLSPQTVMTKDQQIVRVVQCSDTEWVAADGTIYTID